MFSKAQWLALMLALSATVSAAPNPDVVAVTGTHTTTAKLVKATDLPAGCPHWVKMLVAPDLQEKVCKKLPKIISTPHAKVEHRSTSSSTTSSSTSSTSSTGAPSSGSQSSSSTTTVKKHPKPTGLPAGCPKWVEDYVAAVNLNEACKLVAKEEHPTKSSTMTTATASKY